MKVGDLVFLKSGSPLMTVSAVGAGGITEVIWFNERETLEKMSVPGEFLTTEGVVDHNQLDEAYQALEDSGCCH